MVIKKLYLALFVLIFLAVPLLSAEETGSYEKSINLGKNSDGKIVVTPSPGGYTGPFCGDGVLHPEIGEQCDGSVYGLTCADLKYDSGELSCSSQCTFDTFQCSVTTSPASSGGKTGSSGGGSGGGSSSSSSSKVCVENWECSEWSNEVCGVRKCIDANKCSTTDLKPSEKLDCDYFEEQGYEFEDKGFFSFITGSAVGAFGSFGWWILLLLLILIVVFFIVSKKKKESAPVKKDSKKGKKSRKV